MDFHTDRGNESPQALKPDEIALSMEEAIIGGKLAPDTKLPPETVLARELGVSRSTLRDALRKLEVRGLIDRRRGRGTIVQGPAAHPHEVALTDGLGGTDAPLWQALEVRACVEPPVAALAADRASEVDLRHLARLEQRMSDTGLSPSQFAILDQLFHRTIAVYSHNPMLVSLLDRVTEIITVSRQSPYLTAARQQSSIKEHHAILAAILDHDPARASDAASHHIDSLRSRLVSH
ncbi:FadR family transcriptional regulator [Pseudoclavibacter sp. CFCC 13796]|uniref:FadR/GntR family transcriptional regulator n=1 Tax=Pseudoclavibacter sp. CFCC 13796 TaxID=2615179 RepID=UPI0013011E50|nr:FadR family transcriptional regulator [Pseudoclavibacter sp. CFCC 13796]